MNAMVYIAPFIGLIGLGAAYMLYAGILKQSEGNDKMKEIAEMIHSGAMTFLRREYTILAGFIGVVFILLMTFITKETAIAFIVGAVCSMAAGFIGMKGATRANVRTSAAANQSGQEAALQLAFSRWICYGPHRCQPWPVGCQHFLSNLCLRAGWRRSGGPIWPGLPWVLHP